MISNKFKFSTIPDNIKEAIFKDARESYEDVVEDWEAFCNKLYGSINIAGTEYLASEILHQLNEDEYSRQMIGWATYFTDDWVYHEGKEGFYYLPEIIRRWAAREYVLTEDDNGSI